MDVNKSPLPNKNYGIEMHCIYDKLHELIDEKRKFALIWNENVKGEKWIYFYRENGIAQIYSLFTDNMKNHYKKFCF